ncbi:MAG: DUF5989 family protein [Planctomycetota bacterium]
MSDAALPFGRMEWIFLSLWVVFSVLFWLTYRRDEKLPLAALKVGGLLGFVYSVMRFFDWLGHTVPAKDRIVFFIEQPAVDGPRVPQLADAFFWFVMVLLVLVAWYARKKVGTVSSLVLSAWDRGHWYMLPVIFVLMTVGLLLVAAAASPVLSPFIYTVF